MEKYLDVRVSIVFPLISYICDFGKVLLCTWSHNRWMKLDDLSGPFQLTSSLTRHQVAFLKGHGYLMKAFQIVPSTFGSPVSYKTQNPKHAFQLRITGSLLVGLSRAWSQEISLWVSAKSGGRTLKRRRKHNKIVKKALGSHSKLSTLLSLAWRLSPPLSDLFLLD